MIQYRVCTAIFLDKMELHKIIRSGGLGPNLLPDAFLNSLLLVGANQIAETML